MDKPNAVETHLLGERFVLQRRLGAGAFGIVYEAVDRVNKTVVALKELIAVDAAGVSRFKAEFRMMADLHHPNLVALHELFAIDGRWFCTMDLVRGLDFRRHTRQPGVRGAPGCDLERLRAALPQLVDAVSACHQAGYLHRDIKPSNILVRHDGRLVLLDFGLCSLTDTLGNQASFHGSYAGTPAYTAPEVFRQQLPSRASDWFSVGVVLYEALLGKLPFTSSWLMGVRGDASDMLRDNLAVVPDDLRELCLGWLRLDPNERAGAVPFVALGAGGRRTEPPPSAALIGREAELSTLRRAWDAVLQGQPTTVRVRGSSGIGKTTLVQRFLQEVRGMSSALVIEGRCFEHESVPYKALDVALENLAKHLRRQALAVADCVAPANLEPLLQVFPCFRPLDEPFDAELDGSGGRLFEIRERAFLGLGDVLDALSRRWQVVLSLDDLQWSDRDSAAALRSLLTGGRRWPLLLVASHRSGAESESAVVQLLDELARRAPGHCHTVELEPLTADEARDLVESLVPGAAPETMTHLYEETGGSPYLLRELGQELALRGPASERRASLSSRTILARLEELTPIARGILELLALAGRPLDIGVFAPGDAHAAEALPNAFAELRKKRLVVSHGLRGSEHVDVYHDKIREGVLSALDSDRRKALHEQLGTLLERCEVSEPEELMRHFHASEDWPRVQRYALLAAQRASVTLAFARAADLFELVLGLPGGSEDPSLVVALAEALANSGRGLQAAKAFRRAAGSAPVEQRLALRRRAAEQFLRSGYIDEGRSELGVVLRAVGLRFSPSSGAALVSVLMQSARLRLRGLEFRPRAAPVTKAVRERLETCWAVSTGLASVDLIHAYQFVLEYLRLALDAGDAQAVARGLCLYAGAVATEGIRRAEVAASILKRAEALAPSGDWHTHGWVLTERSVLTWSLGNWAEAVALTEQALAVFTEHCRNVAWEIAFLNLIRFTCLLELGQLERLGRLLPPLLADTLNRGDLFAVTNFRTKLLAFVALARDRPEEAQAEAEEATLAWSKVGWHYQHWFAVYSQAHVALYTGRGVDAHALVTGCWPRLAKSLILRHQLARVHATSLLGRSALAAYLEVRSSSLLTEAERCAAKLDSDRLPYATACAAVLRAGVASERRAALRHLEAAMPTFGSLGMKLHEAAARWRWGELLGGAEGEAAVSSSTAAFQSEGVVAPSRYVAVLIPALRLSPSAFAQRSAGIVSPSIMQKAVTGLHS